MDTPKETKDERLGLYIIRYESGHFRSKYGTYEDAIAVAEEQKRGNESYVII